MNFVTFQNMDIPCAFVTGISYNKTARTYTHRNGEITCRGFEPAEISCRVLINAGVCGLVGEDYREWLDFFDSITPEKKTAPDRFYVNGNPLYASMLFSIVSINKTYLSDETGFIYQAEYDFNLAGVQCAKDASREKVLVIESDTLNIPKTTLKVYDKSIVVEGNLSISEFVLTEKGGVIQIMISDDSIEVARGWSFDLVTLSGEIEIENYGTYYVVSASLVDDELNIAFSIFNETYRQDMLYSRLDCKLSDVFEEFEDRTEREIDYFRCNGNKIEELEKLQASLGFLIDYRNKLFVNVPETIKPNNTLVLNYTEDLIIETISQIVWRDGTNEHKVGNNKLAIKEVSSICRCSDSDVANQCLRYYNFMLNSITVEAPLNSSIRQWSSFYINKNATQIPVCVSHFEFNFISNTMTLTLNYLGSDL